MKKEEFIMIIYGTLGRKFIKWLSKYCDEFEVRKVCNEYIRYGKYFDKKRYNDEKVMKNLKYSRPYIVKCTLNDDFATTILFVEQSFPRFISYQWKAEITNTIWTRNHIRGIKFKRDLYIGINDWVPHNLKNNFPSNMIYYHDRKKGVENGNMD
jgi:hypothetical protein